MDKLRDLLRSLARALSRSLGERCRSKFAELVMQGAKLKKDGAPEVSFRVAREGGS